MNRNAVLFLFIVLISSIHLSACKSRKHKPHMDPTTTQDSIPNAVEGTSFADEFFLLNKEFYLKNVDLKFISAKSKVDIKTSEGQSINLTFNYRIEMGKKIWLSISALGGIEVARVLINQDSVKVLDRFNTKYIKNDFNYLSALLGIPMNYEVLEALILNNFIALNPIDQNELSIQNDKFLIRNENIDTYQYQLIDTLNKKVIQYNFGKKSDSVDFQINYSDYRIFESKYIPFKFEALSTTKGKTMNLSAELIKIQKEESLDFPFNIPQKFN